MSKEQSACGAAPHASVNPINRAMLFALALLAALGPFGTDLYLPAFPAMTADLSTTATGVQLSFTAFLIGMAAGQLMFGPWSDRAGRMGPLLAGLALFLIASAAAVFARSIETLVAARLLQGWGGAAGMVIGRAIVLDHVREKAAARTLNLMMIIVGIAPVVAPLVGGMLAESIGWRGLLALVGALGVAATGATLLFARESLPREVRVARARAGEHRGAWKALLSRGYLGHVAACGFGMAVLMAYISASPFVYQEMIGLSAAAYGLAFAVNAVGFTAATAVSSRLIRRFALRTLTAAGLLINLAAVLVILLLTLAHAPAAWLMVPMFFVAAPFGLVLGNATALALSVVPRSATGTASAFLGALQFTLAGIGAGLVNISGEGTALPLALTMLGAVIAAMLGLIVAGGGPQSHRPGSLPG